MQKREVWPGHGWLSTGEAVIEPARFSSDLGVPGAVICFTESSYKDLLSAFDAMEGADAPRFPGALAGKFGDGAVIYRSSFGAPAAGMLIDTLIASGVRRILMLGEAGSISPLCGIGDIVLPTWGLREEGTSYHYLAPDVVVTPAEKLCSSLRKALGSTGFREGGVWSTDAPYRETRDKVVRYAREGVLAVDMECTALMAIAMCRGVDFAALLVITDELFHEEWVEGFRSEEVAAARSAAANALREVLRG